MRRPRLHLAALALTFVGICLTFGILAGADTGAPAVACVWVGCGLSMWSTHREWARRRR